MLAIQPQRKHSITSSSPIKKQLQKEGSASSLKSRRDPSSSIASERLNPNAKFPREKQFCLPWTVNADDWWKRHPSWEAGMENETHYCFAPMAQAKARLFQKVYNSQYRSDCSNVLTQEMISSGWGADFMHVADALWYGLQHQRPVQVTNHTPWHYASAHNQSACPMESMYCYFLDLTPCPPDNANAYNGIDGREFFQEVGHPDPRHPTVNRLIEYATRPQTWLRKQVYDFSKQIPLEAPCSVLHVRRSDIVLHHKWSRKYRDLEEYMNASSSTIQKTILLLTDDSNAIQEAHSKYPDYNWVYIDRPRFQGPEGGFENQIPSNDPKYEVLVLLSIFRLVRKCQSLVHTKSNLGQYLAGIMKLSPVPNVTIVNLDENLSLDQIHNWKYDIRRDPKWNQTTINQVFG